MTQHYKSHDGQYLAQLHEISEHDNCGSVLFPDHPPKVHHRLLQRSLRCYVLLLTVVALRYRML